MPHVALHLASGRSDADKQRLADAFAEALTATIGSPADSISVSIEDVAMDDWPQFYRREIVAWPELLFKPPGYTL
ncbi:tautomerase family protein [Sphingomonas sp. R-74633]|uniref:tautomerase family protein n=1 Tax=Sphingomonas sp. R-74633 TaxID=2751188 RepID=UPI0015D15157|nr:tautomerase family protein [Sphingomonas sp. R-74633]NYT41344.1 tautomerase family protein [Sphingomonas sp. R-74633]